MNTKPNAIRDGLDAVRQTSLDLYAGRRVNNVNLRAAQHRDLALGKNRQVAELVRVLQDGRASRECGLFGVQPIAEVVRDHAVRFHIATVMYGCRLALVALEPVVDMPTETPVVAESVTVFSGRELLSVIADGDEFPPP